MDAENIIQKMLGLTENEITYLIDHASDILNQSERPKQPIVDRPSA